MKKIQNYHQQNISKVQYFLQKNDQNKPMLPSQICIMQLLRQYLNDDDLQISYKGKPVFLLQGYQQKLQTLYDKWVLQQKQELNIDIFIIYWLRSQQQLEVNYSLYQDMMKNQQDYKSDISAKQNQNIVDQIIPRNQIFKDSTSANNIKNNSIKLCAPLLSISHINNQSHEPLDYLKKFFTFYAKQSNTINNATFNQYEQSCKSISLIKWMHYLRDVGIIGYTKAMNSQKMKEIFTKFENKDKVLTFQLFQLAINQILKILFLQNQQIIANQGYNLLGIKDKKCFQQKFKNMGIIPPIFDKRAIFNSKRNKFDRISKKVSLAKIIDCKINLNNSVQLQNQKQVPRQIVSSSSQHLPKIITNNNSKVITSYRQRPPISMTANIGEALPSHATSQLQSSRLTKLTAKHRHIHRNQALIHQMMQDQQQQDPYLKRYNCKQNIKYHCIANRIDQRIQRIKNKYDQQQ